MIGLNSETTVSPWRLRLIATPGLLSEGIKAARSAATFISYLSNGTVMKMMIYSLVLVGLCLASVSAQTVSVTRAPYVVAASSSADPEWTLTIQLPIDFVNQTVPWKFNLTGLFIDRQPVVFELQATENQAHFAIYKFRLFHREGKDFNITVRGELRLKNKSNPSQDIVRKVNEKVSPRNRNSKVFPLLEKATILKKSNGWLSYNSQLGKDVITIVQTIKYNSKV